MGTRGQYRQSVSLVTLVTLVTLRGPVGLWQGHGVGQGQGDHDRVPQGHPGGAQGWAGQGAPPGRGSFRRGKRGG